MLACYGVVRDGRLGHSVGRPNGSAGLLGCPEAAGLQSQGPIASLSATAAGDSGLVSNKLDGFVGGGRGVFSFFS